MSDTAGQDSLSELDNFTYSTWRRIKLYPGEPMHVTTKYSPTVLNGSPCVIRTFKWFPKVTVFDNVMDHFKSAYQNIKDRRIGGKELSAVLHSAEEGGLPRVARVGVAGVGVHAKVPLLPHHADVANANKKAMGKKEDLHVIDTVEKAVEYALLLFLSQVENEEDGCYKGYVLVPVGSALSTTNIAVCHTFWPRPELVMDEGGKLVAVRISYPVVPAVVRPAVSMLSATIKDGTHIVAHNTSSADVTADDEAHNAAFYVAVSRVCRMAHLAITLGTTLHDNMPEPRAPLRQLLQEMKGYNGHARVYHCKTPSKVAGLAPPTCASWDARLREQHEMGFFDEDD